MIPRQVAFLARSASRLAHRGFCAPVKLCQPRRSGTLPLLDCRLIIIRLQIIVFWIILMGGIIPRGHLNTIKERRDEILQPYNYSALTFRALTHHCYTLSLLSTWSSILIHHILTAKSGIRPQSTESDTTHHADLVTGSTPERVSATNATFSAFFSIRRRLWKFQICRLLLS